MIWHTQFTNRVYFVASKYQTLKSNNINKSNRSNKICVRPLYRKLQYIREIECRRSKQLAHFYRISGLENFIIIVYT